MESLPYPSYNYRLTASLVSWGDAGDLRVGTRDDYVQAAHPGIQELSLGTTHGGGHEGGCCFPLSCIREVMVDKGCQHQYSPTWREHFRQNNIPPYF